MKYRDIEINLKELRNAWKLSNDEEEKAHIQEIAESLKKDQQESFGCYQCDDLLSREQLPEAFCSDECKKAYWGNSYDIKKERKSWTVEEMVEGLKRIAQDEREKGNRS